MTYCKELSEKHVLWPRAAERAAVEAVRAAGVAVAISAFADFLDVSLNIPMIVVGYVIAGGAMGMSEGQDRRRDIIRDCLRDKGYKAY